MPAAPGDDGIPIAIPVLVAAPPDACGPETAPAGPPPLRALDVLLGIALIWPVELFMMAGLGLATAILARTRLPALSGWQVHPVLMCAYSLASAVWTCAVVWLLACRLKRRTLADGLALRPPGRWWLAWSAPLGSAMALAGALVSAQWGREDTMIARMGSTPVGLAGLGVLALMMAPVEEIYYRGLVFPALRHTLGAAWAALIVVAWFAAIHVMQLRGAGGLDIASLACVAGAGLVFIVIRHRTGSLLPAIAAHFSYNATLIALSAVSMAI